MNRSYQVNSPIVMSETIDGETMVINLETGNYYSLNRSASTIWQAIERLVSLEQIVGHVKAGYTGSEGQISREVEEFVWALRDENLVVPYEDSVEGFPELDTPTSRSMEFMTPSMTKYSDMQALLVADPIHDVDETGWPRTKTGR